MKKQKVISAIENKDLKTIKMFLAQGLDPNENLDRNMGNSLHLAVLMQAWDLVKELVEHGGNVTTPEPGGTTPLQSVCLYGHAESIALLIDAGADVNCASLEEDPELKGRTPLMQACACMGGDLVASIKILLQNGADVNARDFRERTPLIHLVDSVKGRKTARMFTRFDSDSSEKGLGRLFGSISNIIRMSKDIATGTFSMGVSKEDVGAIELLLEAGADINAQDKIGNTALYHAKMERDDTLIEFLVSKGATWDKAQEASLANPNDDFDDYEPTDYSNWENKYFSEQEKTDFLSTYKRNLVVEKIASHQKSSEFQNILARVSERFSNLERGFNEDWMTYKFTVGEASIDDISALQAEVFYEGALLFVSREDVLKGKILELSLFPSADCFDLIAISEFAQGNADIGVEDVLLRFKALYKEEAFRIKHFDYATVKGEFLNQVKNPKAILQIFYGFLADSCVIGELYEEEEEEEKYLEKITKYYSKNNDFYFWWD